MESRKIRQNGFWLEGVVNLREYKSPKAEQVSFENDGVLTTGASSGSCRCYLDIGVKNDYSAAGSNCWTDSEDASAYDIHDAPID